MTRSFSRRLPALLCAGIALVFVLVTAMPLAASAHDQVLSTTPAPQEHLDDAPGDVTMRFSEELLEIGATILVVDAAGTNWVSGEVGVKGQDVVQALATGIPDGNYQVRWQVVSSDGHPISGTFEFSVGETSTASPAPTATDQPSVAPTPGDDTASSANQDTTPVPLFLLVGIGGALAGVTCFLLIVVLVRRRHRG